jgi:KaiC/GvpD/RAD55 family RecA-like ATPase
MKNREIGAFQVETAKLTVKSLKTGTFIVNPQAIYFDDLGKTKTYTLPPLTITSNPPTTKPKAEGKIPSGTQELDHLLLGGIPEKYAVALATPSNDERYILIKRFIESGIETGETTFHITTEAANTKALAEKHQANFCLILCNPQADAIIPDWPNVYKLKGIESLTGIDIALTKAFRTLSASAAGPKRICIDIVSDALLQHHAINVRRWLSALLPTLKLRGFTILAVIDTEMHATEETRAILGLFDGEINICQKETPKGMTSYVRIKKMIGQKYLKEETSLTEK